MNDKPELPETLLLEGWRQNFLALHQARLKEIKKQLNTQAATVIECVPLLLHINNSRLPGFVSTGTPCGVINYQPSPEGREAINKIVPGIVIPKELFQRLIRSICLENNPLSLLETSSNEIQMTVFVEHIQDFQYQSLLEKCEKIAQWALSQKTKLTIRIKRPTERISQSDLDVFYTNSTHLAGKIPQWWLLPEEFEENPDDFWAHIPEAEEAHPWFDLGSPYNTTPNELASRGLELIKKVISSPYTPALELFKNSYQCTGYPQQTPLAQKVKQLIHSDQATLENTEPAGLTLSKIEDYLNQEFQDSLIPFVRKAFYFSTDIRVSELNQGQRSKWRTQQLLETMNTWDWENSYIRHLDEKESWHALDVMNERNLVAQVILFIFKKHDSFLEQKADQANRKEVQQLKNQIDSYFDGELGKVPDINPGICDAMMEEKITLHSSSNCWRLIPGSWKPEMPIDSIYESNSLIEVLLFAHRNGLLGDYSHLTVYPAHNTIDSYELKALLSDIQNITKPSKDKIDFSTPKDVTKFQIFVNTGEKPRSNLSRQGMEKISDIDDALGFSVKRENLVRSVDLVITDTWGEWVVKRFTGGGAVLDFLMHVLSYRSSKENCFPEWEVYCHSQVRAVVIAKRINSLLTETTQHFLQADPPPYLLQISHSFHLLERRHGNIISHDSENQSEFLTLLAKPRRRYRRWAMDRYALADTPIKFIMDHAKGGYWQVWFWRKREITELYIMDERGALSIQQLPKQNIREVLTPIMRLLHTLNGRWISEEKNKIWPINLYEIKQDKEKKIFSAEPRKIPVEAYNDSPSIKLEANITHDKKLSIQCMDEIFSQETYGKLLIKKVIECIHSQGNISKDTYINLSDIRVEGSKHLMTHMQYHKKVQRLLNMTVAKSFRQAQTPLKEKDQTASQTTD